MESESNLQSMTDLLGNTRYLSPKSGTPISERAGIVKYFADTFGLNGKRLAIKMSHIKNIDDLYYLQSDTKDIIKRKGLTAARKAMYARIRTNEINNENIK